VSQWLELVFLDPKGGSRLRKRPAWQAIVAEARQSGNHSDNDAPPLPGQEPSEEDRADAHLILARASATDAAGVSAALSEAVRDDGKRATPLVLLAGELSLPFDELAELKATLTTATPFAAGDEPLEAALGAAKDFLETPGLLAAPAVVESLTSRIHAAFRRTKRAVPPEYIQIQSERALIDQRCFQQRMFQGKPHLRGLLSAAGERGDGAGMLVFLPVAAAASLPLCQRFGARLVAEAHPLADQLESHPFALRVLALARSAPPAPRGAGQGPSRASAT
jgi:hypothetical protein